jgi:hypothetical protein
MELDQFKRFEKVVGMVVAVGNFWPSLIPLVVFATFILFGN